jgi:hypothetical protein
MEKKKVSVFRHPNDGKNASCHFKKIVSVFTHPNDVKTLSCKFFSKSFLSFRIQMTGKTRHFCRYATKIMPWDTKFAVLLGA